MYPKINSFIPLSKNIFRKLNIKQPYDDYTPLLNPQKLPGNTLKTWTNFLLSEFFVVTRECDLPRIDSRSTDRSVCSVGSAVYPPWAQDRMTGRCEVCSHTKAQGA